MIAQKCMRRLWFVEDGETNVIFRGKGAKTKARQYASIFTAIPAGSIYGIDVVVLPMLRDDFDKAPPLRGPWQVVGPTLDEYVSPPPSYQPWEVT